MAFRMRHYKQGRERLVAACDEELVGKRFEEGQLQLHVDPGFYDGMRVEADALTVQLRSCTVANLVGERSVALGVEIGMIDPGNVLRIQGVPHAQWALLF